MRVFQLMMTAIRVVAQHMDMLCWSVPQSTRVTLFLIIKFKRYAILVKIGENGDKMSLHICTPISLRVSTVIMFLAPLATMNQNTFSNSFSR